MKKERIKHVEYMMLLFNVTVVLGMSVFIYVTTIKICGVYGAADFLERVGAIPWNPRGLFLTNCLLLSGLGVSYLARETYFKGRPSYEYLSLVIDLLLSLAIIYLLGFNYNGLLFWVFANVISRVEDVKWKYIMFAISVISYIATDYGLASINLKVYSIENYIGYYDATIQKYMYGVYTLILSLNIILFLIFCVHIILVQLGTITEVERLYQQLSNANQGLQEANVQLQKYADIKEKMGETKERNRLAREIHDTLGHTLTGISAGVDACLTTIEYAPEVTRQQLETISLLSREGIQEVRRSVNELRPELWNG